MTRSGPPDYSNSNPPNFLHRIPEVKTYLQ